MKWAIGPSGWATKRPDRVWRRRCRSKPRHMGAPRCYWGMHRGASHNHMRRLVQVQNVTAAAAGGGESLFFRHAQGVCAGLGRCAGLEPGSRMRAQGSGCATVPCPVGGLALPWSRAGPAESPKLGVCAGAPQNARRHSRSRSGVPNGSETRINDHSAKNKAVIRFREFELA